MNKNNKNYLLAIPLCLSLGCSETTENQPLPNDIQEPAGIYYSSPPDVIRVDVKTVTPNGPCVPGDYTGCTLEDVNNDTDTTDDFEPELIIQFTADDFPDDSKPSNASFRLRGQSARHEGIKSYRIKLDSKDALWRGERRLQLNKHASDFTRVRNKLSFDMMAAIPNLPSLRTQFVNLFIDNTDYGFYTHVEYVGKEYLTRRNWDEDSGIYKAEYFDFTLHDALLLNELGAPLNEAAFETVLETKRGDDHRALLKMLNAVNNANNNFETDVLNKHFNLNNFLAWEAAIILMGNTDVTKSNYYLYNPKGTEAFYFLPWDFSSTWGYDWTPSTIAGGFAPGQAHQGPHNLWASTFGRRFLSQPNGLDLLNEAVLEIKEKYLTPEKIAALTSSYYNLVFPFVTSEPDIGYLATNQKTFDSMFVEYDTVYEGMIESVQKNYDRFLKVQHSPMPFNVEQPYLSEDNIILNWEAAVDLQGDAVSYDVDIATMPGFAEDSIKFSIRNLTNSSYSTPWMLARGDYYLKITARDSAYPTENWQVAANEYYTEGPSKTHYGVVAFSVDINGAQ